MSGVAARSAAIGIPEAFAVKSRRPRCLRVCGPRAVPCDIGTAVWRSTPWHSTAAGCLTPGGMRRMDYDATVRDLAWDSCMRGTSCCSLHSAISLRYLWRGAGGDEGRDHGREADRLRSPGDSGLQALRGVLRGGGAGAAHGVHAGAGRAGGHAAPRRRGVTHDRFRLYP